MTLFRQLIIVLGILFFTICTINLWSAFNNYRILVSEQIKTHTKDTADLLELFLSQTAEKGDLAALEAIIGAISDNGFWQQIIFRDSHQQILVDRKFTAPSTGVPEWFVSMAALPDYQDQREILAAGRTLGSLTVISHSGPVYQALWRTMSTQFSWFLLMAVLVCLLVVLGLRRLLESLQKVEAQATAIMARRFELQTDLPKTRELRNVVLAMNRMSTRLSDQFNEQIELIARLRANSTLDPVSKLSNREDFDAQLNSFIAPETGARAAALFIISLHEVGKINDYAGREEGNMLLANVGLALTDTVGHYPGSLIARRQGGDFTVFLPDIDKAKSKQLAVAALAQVRAVSWHYQESMPLVFHMGFAHSEAIEEPRRLLSEADIALKKAISSGPNHWCDFSEITEGEIPLLHRPMNEWHSYLTECIAQRKVELLLQPVFTVATQEQIDAEAFARFRTDGYLLPAGVVIPVAERLGLMAPLEKVIIEQAIQRVADTGAGLTLNLSVVSLRTEGFLDWLEQKLKASSHAKQLSFEVSEQALHTAIDQLEVLNQILIKHNSRLGIDHFGLQSSSFAYLNRLSLAYLKVHRSFSQGLAHNSDNQFYLQMLSNLAKNLELEIWVEGVESSEDFEVLKSLGINAAQGYLLGVPV